MVEQRKYGGTIAMNSLFWICFGIVLTVFFPSLTDYAQQLLSGLVNQLVQK